MWFSGSVTKTENGFGKTLFCPRNGTEDDLRFGGSAAERSPAGEAGWKEICSSAEACRKLKKRLAGRYQAVETCRNGK